MSASTSLVIKNDHSNHLDQQWISRLFDTSAAEQTLPNFKLQLYPKRKNFLHLRQILVSFQKWFIPPFLIKHLFQFYGWQTFTVAWRAQGEEKVAKSNYPSQPQVGSIERYLHMQWDVKRLWPQRGLRLSRVNALTWFYCKHLNDKVSSRCRAGNCSYRYTSYMLEWIGILI